MRFLVEKLGMWCLFGFTIKTKPPPRLSKQLDAQSVAQPHYFHRVEAESCTLASQSQQHEVLSADCRQSTD